MFFSTVKTCVMSFFHKPIEKNSNVMFAMQRLLEKTKSGEVEWRCDANKHWPKSCAETTFFCCQYKSYTFYLHKSTLFTYDYIVCYDNADNKSISYDDEFIVIFNTTYNAKRIYNEIFNQTKHKKDAIILERLNKLRQEMED